MSDAATLAAGLKPLVLPRAKADPQGLVRDILAAANDDVRERLGAALTGAAADLVGAVATQSPFLAGIMRRRPDWLADLLARDPDDGLAALAADLHAAVAAGSGEDDVKAAIRRYRTRAALLIALADCGGVWSVERATAALTDVAETAVRVAADVLLCGMDDAGRLNLKDRADPGPGSGLVILALGKMGAGELNYSSDIDLVVFYDPEAPALPPDAEPARIYVKIAQGLVRLLQERTPDGYAFRVDLRLRPDPGSTAPAVSLTAAFAYYETVGQNWERAAFIKARPVAGDIAVGAAFLKDLAPFIWRKYFDFAAIADIHAMKRQIHAVRGHEEIAVAGHDIKLGRGGIREIEFFVQTQQLVFGGRRPALRGSRTLDMLAALAAEDWITVAARDELSDAYRFLRTVEHRIQMVADEQTQRLPTDGDALAAFARFCGFPSLKAFSAELTRQAHIVQGHYAMLFEDAPSLAADIGSLVFTGTEDDPETLATIARLGFRDPPAVTETVRGWHFGRRPAVTSARAREALTEVTPALLVSLGRSSDPDAALAALDRAFTKMPAAAELLTLLGSKESLRDLFADVLGTAPRLAEIVGQTPHVLDAVIDPAFLEAEVSQEVFEARMRAMLGDAVDMEAFLDRIRDVARHENFVVGARFLSGVLSPDRAGEAFSAVAQAALRLTFERVRAAFAADHGTLKGARAVVLAMGRFGSREMTASSDLDLVVLYDFDPDVEASDGARALDPVTYHTRLTQRLIAALTAPTRRGVLYEVDLRLRPSGRKGPVATQLASFRDYYGGEAETWEDLALLKARVVAGDGTLARDVEAELVRCARRRRDPKTVARDLKEMRKLLADEKGSADPWDVKNASGALTDLDFAVGYLALIGAADHPALATGTFGDRLAAAEQAGLIDPDAAQTLAAARRLFNDLLQWQRLLIRGRFDAADLPKAVGRRIANAMACPDLPVLKAALDEMRGRVSEVTKGLGG